MVGAYQDFAPSTSGRRKGYVITVTSPKGGTGKSSVAINAAVYLGMHLRGSGQRVCLIDANFQQADTGKLLNQYTPNIGNILRDQASIVPERIEEYLVERPNWNTSFLLGPATPKDASPMHYNSQLYSRIVDALRQRFDYILIDTPVAEVYHDILRGFALPEANYIVVPIVPAIYTLMNADAWLRTITLPRHSGGDGIDQGCAAGDTPCAAGLSECVGDVLRVCDANGVWSQPNDCAAAGKVCSNQLGCVVCLPGRGIPHLFVRALNRHKLAPDKNKPIITYLNRE
jgi:hypothetical protein